MWGTYGGVREHWLVQCCRNNPATFSRIAEQNRTAVSMEFFKERMGDTRESGYVILDGFHDTFNADFFNKVELTFDQPAYLGKLDAQTQLQFFNVVFRMLKWKDAINTTKERDWNTIFNNEIEEMDNADRERGAFRYSTTQRCTMVTLFTSCMGRFPCFYDLYLGQLCPL